MRERRGEGRDLAGGMAAGSGSAPVQGSPLPRAFALRLFGLGRTRDDQAWRRPLGHPLEHLRTVWLWQLGLTQSPVQVLDRRQ